MDGRRDQCGSQVDRFRLEVRVGNGGYGSSVICVTGDRTGASFANVGATDGNTYIEGVKGEGELLASGAKVDAYAEGVKGEDEGAIFSGRGGTGGISTWRLSCGGKKTGPWSTPAAARGRVDLLDIRDLSPLDVTDPRRDSTVGSGVFGCIWGCVWVWIWERICGCDRD
jgi:hypothetical protein